MNGKLKLIFERRSVRKYGKDAVSDGEIRDMLEAAMAAPSACCKDPWHFIVLRDREILEKTAAGLPHGGMLADAGAGIVVCGALSEAHDGMLSYMLQDCSAAIENILLAASSLGLGAVWLGAHPREDRIEHLRKTLGIPESITPISVVSIGRPAEKKEARTRYNRAKVHTDRW